MRLSLMNAALKVGQIMVNKSRSKYFITIIIVIILLVLVLCACSDPAIRTQETSICLPVSGSKPITMEGQFPIVAIKTYTNSAYTLCEILPNQFDDFLAFLESREYYRGKTTLKDTSTLFPSEIKPFKTDDECLWFSHEGMVWVGKKYANKFFYIAQVHEELFNSEDIWGTISHFLLDEKITSTSMKEIGVEYPTSLSWEDIKKVYSEYDFDDDNHTVKIPCYLPHSLEKDGLTTLVYNQENSTIKILNDYTEN